MDTNTFVTSHYTKDNIGVYGAGPQHPLYYLHKIWPTKFGITNLALRMFELHLKLNCIWNYHSSWLITRSFSPPKRWGEMLVPLIKQGAPLPPPPPHSPGSRLAVLLHAQPSHASSLPSFSLGFLSLLPFLARLCHPLCCGASPSLPFPRHALSPAV